MSADMVVEAFEVVKETFHRLFSCIEMPVMHEFLLEIFEEHPVFVGKSTM
jgi:hypothetical protein